MRPWSSDACSPAFPSHLAPRHTRSFPLFLRAHARPSMPPLPPGSWSTPFRTYRTVLSMMSCPTHSRSLAFVSAPVPIHVHALVHSIHPYTCAVSLSTVGLFSRIRILRSSVRQIHLGRGPRRGCIVTYLLSHASIIRRRLTLTLTLASIPFQSNPIQASSSMLCLYRVSISVSPASFFPFRVFMSYISISVYVFALALAPAPARLPVCLLYHTITASVVVFSVHVRTESVPMTNRRSSHRLQALVPCISTDDVCTYCLTPLCPVVVRLLQCILRRRHRGKAVWLRCVKFLCGHAARRL